MNVRGVLLDFDGVLLDSFREGVRRIQIICALHDIPFKGREARTKLFSMWGLPGIVLLQKCLEVNEALAKRMYTSWERIDETDPLKLVPGARETLVWLRRNEIRTALVTSRLQESLLRILDQLDVEREFSVICAKEDVGPYTKPDPRVFRYTLETLEEKHGIRKDQCIFVGDTASDTVAGQKAELTTLVVQTGPYLLEHMRDNPIPIENVLKAIDDLPFWMEKYHEGDLSPFFG